jgi:hypothetical protein
MFSCGSCDLRSHLNRCRCNTVINGSYREFVYMNGSNREFVFVNGSNGEFSVMNGSNGELSIVNGSNGQSGIYNSESQFIGDIGDNLEFASGVNVSITSSLLTKSVTNFLFGRVEVRITVLGVAKFIPSMELTRYR